MDPALRGRLITAVLGVAGLTGFWWLFSSKTKEVDDTQSGLSQTLIASGCQEGGMKPGTVGFASCVKRATAECNAGGVGKNLATCARVMATREDPALASEPAPPASAP